MTFRAIVGKEVADLAREKRFGGWALAFLAFWTFVLFMFLMDVRQSAFNRSDYPMSLLQLTEGAFFVFAISFVVLALFILSDGVTKERESGMLPVVGATPAVRWHVLAAKLIAGLVAYVAAFLIALLPGLVFAFTLGFPMVTFLAKLFFGPFLVLYLFLLGAGLVFGVAFSSSKVAIGTATGIYLPLFLMMRDGPLENVYRSYPRFSAAADYLPFQSVFDATQVIAYGGAMPWPGLLVSAGIGVALSCLAFYLFQRQEVAA